MATQSAAEAYGLVLAGAGATLPARDSADSRVVADVRRGGVSVGNGIVDSPGQVGGWPHLKSVPAPTDTDGDGIPDAWETSHGLNPRDPSDGNATKLAGPYTNLELYLNSIGGR